MQAGNESKPEKQLKPVNVSQPRLMPQETGEAYVYFTSDDNYETITIYCDNKMDEREGIQYWILFTSDGEDIRTGIKKVILDVSLSEHFFELTSVFEGFSALETIENMHFLNLSYTTTTERMFYGCSSLSVLDLQTLAPNSYLQNVDSMFAGCTSLKTIYCNYDISQNEELAAGKGLFAGCTKLTGDKGTTYDPEQTGAMYARPDKGGENPGYFTVPLSDIYGVLSKDGKTFTIRYDGNKSANKGLTPNEWATYEFAEKRGNVVTIDIDPTMDYARPTNLAYWFDDFYSATSIYGLYYLHTDEVTDMTYLFHDCMRLEKIDLSCFNTSKVTKMKGMFSGCEKLKRIGVIYFDTKNVTDMNGMFMNCKTVKELDVYNFDMSNVTDASKMFAGCEKLKVILCDDDWSGLGFTDDDMFKGCTSIQSNNELDTPTPYDEGHTGKEYAHPDGENGQPGYFTTPKKMYAVFTDEDKTVTFYYDRKIKERNGVEDREWAKDEYAGTRAKVEKAVFDQSVNNYNCQTLSDWFNGFSHLASIEHLEYFDTKYLKDVSQMFLGCSALEEVDISSFRFDDLENASEMFKDCPSLKTIYCNWDFNYYCEYLKDSKDMFAGCTSLVGGNGTAYDAAHTDASYARWDISVTRPGYFTATENEIYGVYNEKDNSFWIYYDNERLSCHGLTPEEWMDASHASMRATVKIIKCWWWLGNPYPKSTANWFKGFSSATTIDLGGLNTDSVTDMSNMFSGCKVLESVETIDFETGKVTSMKGMFKDCKELLWLDLGDFDMSHVTDASEMFSGCNNLYYIYCGRDWSVLSFKDDDMFSGCTTLRGNAENPTFFSAEHTGKEYARLDKGDEQHGYFCSIKELYGVFGEDKVFTIYYDKNRAERNGVLEEKWILDKYKPARSAVQKAVFDESVKIIYIKDFGNWFKDFTSMTSIEHLDYINTSHAIYLDYMFSHCESLEEIDLRSFDVEDVKYTSYMFDGCSSLKTIYCNDQWEIQNMNKMFAGCTALQGGAGTKYASDQTDGAYARQDGGKSAPGYFTALYTVTFADMNGEVLKKEDVLQGNGVTAPDAPEVDGYYFKGWDNDFSFVTSDILVKAEYIDLAKATLELYTSFSGTTMTVYYDKLREARPVSYDLDDLPSAYKSLTRKVVFDETVKDAELTSLSNLCANMYQLREVEGLQHINAALLEDVSFLFQNCKSLVEINLNGFDIKGVTAAYGMFQGCGELTTVFCDADFTNLAGMTSLGMFDGCNKIVGGKGTKWEKAHIDASYARPDRGVEKPGYFTATLLVKDSFLVSVVVDGLDAELVNITGAKKYGEGDPATLGFELLDEHYVFDMWTWDGNFRKTETVKLDGVTEDMELTLHFVPKNYTVTAVASPEEGGTVTGAGTAPYLSVITLTAVPAEGWQFDGWQDDNTAPAERSITVFGETTYTALFSKQTETGIDQTLFPSGEARGEASKLIRNGTLYILVGDRLYDATGRRVK